MDYREYGKQLLEEYNLCCRAKPKHNVVDIQLDKDVIAPWAMYLNRQLAWGDDVDVAEACRLFETRLKSLKEKIVIEVLKNGAV